MLNRRILRIKAFKTLYSYAENPSMSLKEAEVQLEKSCQATRDLYLYLLAMAAPLTAEALSRIEAARSKFNPTEEERNPNLKFVNNRIAPLFAEDPDFQKLFAKKHFSWENNDAFLRKLYETIRERDYFKKYMASAESSLKEDAALFYKIYEQELEDNADLEAILEDMSIYWNDDLAYSLTQCCKTFIELGKGSRWELPPLYLSEITSARGANVDSDRDFVVKVLHKAFLGYDRYRDMVAASTRKWEKDRLFVVDTVLVIMALAEVEQFPDVPARIPVNEYVEISKYYGTPRSSSFVNGLLDHIIKDELSLTI